MPLRDRPKYLVSIVRPARRLKYAAPTSRHHIPGDGIAQRMQMAAEDGRRLYGYLSRPELLSEACARGRRPD
jgi:hypothetical protein